MQLTWTERNSWLSRFLARFVARVNVDDQGMARVDEQFEAPEATIAHTPEFISVPEWCRRVGVSKDSAYKAARSGRIPGCFAIGRLYRINWSAFVERSGLAGGHVLTEESGVLPVALLDHAALPTERGGRVRGG